MKNIKIYSVTVENQELLFSYAKNAKAESKEVVKVELQLKDFKELLFSGVLQDGDEYIKTRAKQLQKMQPSKLNEFQKEIIKQAESLEAGQVERQEEVKAEEKPKGEVKEEVKKEQEPKEEEDQKNNIDIAAVLAQMEKMQNQLNSVLFENEQLKAKQPKMLSREELKKWYLQIDDKQERINKFEHSIISIKESIEILEKENNIFGDSYNLQISAVGNWKPISLRNNEIIYILLKDLKVKSEEKLKELKTELENLKNL